MLVFTVLDLRILVLKHRDIFKRYLRRLFPFVCIYCRDDQRLHHFTTQVQ